MTKLKFLVKFGLILALAVFALSGCGAKEGAKDGAKTGTPEQQQVVLKIGATPVPHAEILNAAKEALAKEGVTLKIVEFQDYVQPNLTLADKELDANFFQHIQYLNSFNKDHNLTLVSAGGIHVEPMGIYSRKIKALTEIKAGSKVAIPNDPSNGSRALLLLQKAGLIKLDPAKTEISKKNIIENPQKLQITELEAAMLPKVLDDVQFAVINTNYALDAGLNPTKDALFIEGKDSPYVNIITTRSGDEKSPAIQKLIKVLTSPEIKKFIEDKYKGAVVPAF